jgi:nucleotide-binding universal stress UspA family protein
MVHVKKILYPTDFSSYSNQAYFHAVALAENHGAGLTVLYVYNPPKTEAGAGAAADADADRRYWRDQLEQIRPANPAIPVHHVFLEGDPAGEIARYATDANIDLIVMGTHGRTGLERLLLGSVAEQTLRNAPCSVLVVKLPKGIPSAEQPKVALAAGPTPGR